MRANKGIAARVGEREGENRIEIGWESVEPFWPLRIRLVARVDVAFYPPLRLLRDGRVAGLIPEIAEVVISKAWIGQIIQIQKQRRPSLMTFFVPHGL